MQIGISGLATGSTAAVINNQQGDDRDATIIINPVTGTLVGTGLASGCLAGFYMNNTPSAEMALAMAMAQDHKRGSGSGYELDAAFAKNYGKKHDRQVQQRGIRGGLRGDSAAAGGVALLQLFDALNNDVGYAVVADC